MTNPVPAPTPAPSWPGFVRFGTAALVGAILAILAKHGIHVSASTEATVLPLLTGFFGFVYYSLMRLLEAKVSPAFGWLLGAAHQPVFPTAASTPPPPPAPVVTPPAPATPPASLATATVRKAPAKKAPAKKAAATKKAAR